MAEDIMRTLEQYGHLLTEHLTDEELTKAYGPVYLDWKNKIHRRTKNGTGNYNH